jgi:hypothetical protein
MAFAYKRASNGIIWARDSRTNATYYLAPATRSSRSRWVKYAPVPRGPAFVPPSPAARPTPLGLPPLSASSGQPVDQVVANKISAIASNPLVQGGLDGLGAALGDPDLGGQVSTGAKVVANVVVPVVNFIGDALGGLFGGGGNVTPQVTDAQLAYNATALLNPTQAMGAAILVPTPAMKGMRALEA